jgi:hypothetical protein
MESKIKQHLAQENPPNTQIFYTAVGWVAGTYQPGEKKFEHGALVTQDGQTIRASLDWYLHHQLKKKQKEAKQQDLLQAVYRWKVYPRTKPLRFDLVQMKPMSLKASSRKRGQQNQSSNLDEFRVVGEIKAIAEEKGKVTVCIRRNQQPPLGKENSPQYQPLSLRINGSLLTASVGQTWDLQVRRSGESLVIADGKLYEPSAEDLAWLEKNLQTLGKSSSDVNQSKADTATKHSGSQHNSSAQTTVNPGKFASGEPLQQQKISSCVPPEKQSLPLSFRMQPHSASSPTKSRKKSKSQTRHPLSAQPQISNPVTKQHSQKQRFSVRVNDQVFFGCNSVNLSKQMVCIDGKPVAQAKMAIVVGQPKTMQADGGVTQGSNQAVLLSK